MISYKKDKFIKKMNRRIDELSLTESDENASVELKEYLRRYIKMLNDAKIKHQKKLISNKYKYKKEHFKAPLPRDYQEITPNTINT